MRKEKQLSATRVGYCTRQVQDRVQDAEDIRTICLYVKHWARHVTHKCNKPNHFARVCRATTAKTHLVEKDTSHPVNELCEETYTMSLYYTSSANTINICVCTASMAGTEVTMEFDTGASVSLISEKEWTRIKESTPQLALNTNNVPRLRTYDGNTIYPLGQIKLETDHNNQHHNLHALVVPGSGPNLLGRDWLSVLKLNWVTVHQVDRDDFLKSHQTVFSERLGTLRSNCKVI